MRVDGGCHCGNITFEAEVDPEKVVVCHCTDCQSITGTAYRVVVPVAKDALKLRGGKPKEYVKKTAESGTPRVQAFCPECGTPLVRAEGGAGVSSMIFRNWAASKSAWRRSKLKAWPSPSGEA